MLTLKTLRFSLTFLFSVFFMTDQPSLASSLTPVAAEDQVKSHACRDHETIDEILKTTIRSHSQRDLGWWVFPDNNDYNVERTVLVSKSFKIHYRWHITQDGQITPASKRAEALCSTG